MCKEQFTPRHTMRKVCYSSKCMEAFVWKHVQKQQEKRAKAEREDTRRRKAAIEPLRDLKKKAQTAFNNWVRARDEGLPCISCGETNPPMKPGGQWDAGHFLSRGAYPELRFNEDNCHRQCKSCNAGGGKFAHKERTVSAKYEEELLRRIGPERLAALRGPHEVKPLTKEYLRWVIDTYRARLKELKKERA